MKKLGKLKLHNAVVLNDNEMKNVVGGYAYGINKTTCTVTLSCSGSSLSCSNDKGYCGIELGQHNIPVKIWCGSSATNDYREYRCRS